MLDDRLDVLYGSAPNQYKEKTGLTVVWEHNPIRLKNIIVSGCIKFSPYLLALFLTKLLLMFSQYMGTI